MEGKLTAKQEAFVREYLIDLNASAAAKRAGYSEKTERAADCYVYALTDPQGGGIFYIGKGSGQRGWVHAQQVARGRVDNVHKCAAIRAILDRGERAGVLILEDGLGHAEAFALEARLIAALKHKGLTNIAAGSSPAVTDEMAAKFLAQGLLARLRDAQGWASRLGAEQRRQVAALGLEPCELHAAVRRELEALC